MLLHLLVRSVRKLIQDRFYSLANVIGLALGMTCCLLLLLYVLHELSFDDHHPQADRVYRLRSDRHLGFDSMEVACTQLSAVGLFRPVLSRALADELIEQPQAIYAVGRKTPPRLLSLRDLIVPLKFARIMQGDDQLGPPFIQGSQFVEALTSRRGRDSLGLKSCSGHPTCSGHELLCSLRNT